MIFNIKVFFEINTSSTTLLNNHGGNTFKPDDNSIKITAPGLWGIRAAQGGLPGVEGDYDHLNLRAFLLFNVK